MDLTEELTAYIKKEYGTEDEHPWPETPENCIFREKLSGKWFALIMRVDRRKLALPGDGEIPVVNVKSDPEMIGVLTQSPGYRPGWHMNKQHWLTVCLDGSVPAEQVFERVDESWDRIRNTPSVRIYEAVKKIPRGKVATYGQVAEMAGDRKMARAVGNALHRNPDPDGVPCYRVVNSKGELSGEFAFGGPGAQARLLEADGIEVADSRVDLKKYGITLPLPGSTETEISAMQKGKKT